MFLSPIKLNFTKFDSLFLCLFPFPLPISFPLLLSFLFFFSSYFFLSFAATLFQSFFNSWIFNNMILTSATSRFNGSSAESNSFSNLCPNIKSVSELFFKLTILSSRSLFTSSNNGKLHHFQFPYLLTKHFFSYHSNPCLFFSLKLFYTCFKTMNESLLLAMSSQ